MRGLEQEAPTHDNYGSKNDEVLFVDNCTRNLSAQETYATTAQETYLAMALPTHHARDYAYSRFSAYVQHWKAGWPGNEATTQN